jgi:UDP-glucuronate 4-epimerase
VPSAASEALKFPLGNAWLALSLLFTGCAGFIGFHVTQYLLERGEQVIGVDDLNAYYDVALKRNCRAGRVEFHQIDVADLGAMPGLLERHSDIETIIHLAA